MVKSPQFTVEAHLVPLPAEEAEDRERRLRALLFRAALRLAHHDTDRDKQPDVREAARPLGLDLVQK